MLYLIPFKKGKSRKKPKYHLQAGFPLEKEKKVLNKYTVWIQLCLHGHVQTPSASTIVNLTLEDLVLYV